MQHYLLHLLCVCLFGVHSLYATEVDSFTQRYEPIDDATVQVNQLTNDLLQEAIAQANQLHRPSAADLYQSIRNVMGGELWAILETRIERSSEIPKHSINRKNSIYGQLGLLQAYPLYIAGLGSLLRMGDYFIGTDKFGHFIEQGFTSFNRAYLQGGGMAAAVKYGQQTEDGFYGAKTTGVYSYGDISANLLGMFFWKNLIEGGEFNDGFVRPYVAIHEGKFILARPFEWEEYLSPLLDEGLNCNRYSSNRTYERELEQGFKRLESRHPSHLRFRCPVEPETCAEFRSSHRISSELLAVMLSPSCQ